MTTYCIVWTEQKQGYVEAPSESAARQAWIDGALDPPEGECFISSIDEFYIVPEDRKGATP